MPDKEIYDWIKRALDHITGYIEAVDKRLNEWIRVVQKCREHCDRCRETCRIRDDHENRLRMLEKAHEHRNGACEAKTKVWYKDPKWWHSTAAWVAIGVAYWLGTRGGLH